jgi:hypothetical protein
MHSGWRFGGSTRFNRIVRKLTAFYSFHSPSVFFPPASAPTNTVSFDLRLPQIHYNNATDLLESIRIIKDNALLLSLLIPVERVTCSTVSRSLFYIAVPYTSI